MAQEDEMRAFRSMIVAIGVLGASVAIAGTATAQPDAKRARPAAVTEDSDSDGHPNTPDPVGDFDNRHPSGKDRHAEGGRSGNQGASSSTPDQNGRGPERDAGGTDKPGGPGGIDTLDQDGNNGCGNDDDFEDDNEGWCGKTGSGTVGATTTTTTVTPTTTTTSMAPTTTSTTTTTVLGSRSTRDDTQVLGTQLTRGTEVQGVLATTGASVIGLAGLGSLAMMTGARIRRRR